MDLGEKGAASSDVLLKALARVSEALGRLRSGAIQLTVHEGKVIQIDITQMRRLTD